VVAAVGISLAYPTIETIVYILVAATNTWVANYKNKSRLVFGMALSYLQIVWVFTVLYTKCTAFADKHHAKGKLTTEVEYQQALKLAAAFGMVVTDENPHEFTFKVNHWESCIPDYIFLFIFLLYLYAQYAAYHRRENAIEQRINILLIKNYELVVKDEEEAVSAVGSNKQRAAAADLEKEENKKAALKTYTDAMTAECKRFDRSYLSAKAFNNQNKPVFGLMLFCQLISSLSFNALIDIPTFAVLVFITGAFPFRKKLPVAFGYLSFFTSYYVKYLSIIKIVYVCISQLPMFKWFLQRYAKDPTVEKVTLLFGLNFNTEKGAIAMERKCEYYGFVVASLALAIVWQQMKFAQAREFCLS
jgi:hypothetical protein